MKYSEIKNRIKPLDLIMFKGVGIYSKFIQINSRLTTSNGDFSHVGIIVTREILDIPQMDPNKLYIWESVSSGVRHKPLNIFGKSFIGTQIRDLEEVIKEYSKKESSKIAVCFLSRNRYPNIEYVKERMQYLYPKYNNRFYDINPCTLFSAVYSCCRGCSSKIEQFTPEWLFCSELVGLIYRDMGIIPISVEPRYIIPVDFIGYDIDNMPKIVTDPEYIEYI